MLATIPTSAPTHGRTALQGPETIAPADWDLGHVTFHDVLSALNPLQYLPVVGMIYREVTGDEVHPALRIAVAGLTGIFFGPIGLAATMIATVVGEVAEAKPPPAAATTATAAATASAAPTAPTAAMAARFSEAAVAYRRAGRAA